MRLNLHPNNKSNLLLWFIAAFLSSSWALNFTEQMVLFALLGVNLYLYRLAQHIVCRLFGNSFLINYPNCPSSNRVEAAQRILMGLTPVIVCALYCCFGFSLLSNWLPHSMVRCAELAAYFNICWACMHMLPIPPFEGWLLADGIFELLMGFKGFSASLLFSCFVSVLCLGSLIYLPLLSGFSQVLSMILFSVLSSSTLSQWKEQRVKMPIDFDEKLQKRLRHFKYRLLKISVRGPVNELDALRIDIEAIQKNLPPQSQSYCNACYLIALAYNLRGYYHEAFQSLHFVAKQLRGESLKLLHELAYKHKNFSLVCQLAKSTYQNFPEPQIAVINGLAHAHCQQISLSRNWLICAKKGGYQVWQLLQDPLFYSWNTKDLAELKKRQ